MIDPYLNPDANVLKNKLGIKDQKELDEAESVITATKLIDVDSVKGNFDYQHLLDIHRHIFEDVYEWAGNARVIDIAKSEKVLSGMSVTYGEHKFIPEEASKVIDEMKAVKWTQLKSYEEKAETFSKHFARLWQVHPFREGNTRTVTEFCVQYASTQGMHIDKELFAKNPGFLRNALVLSSIGEYSERSHLERIVKDAMERGDELRGKKQEQEKGIFSLNGLKKIDSDIKSKDKEASRDIKSSRSYDRD
ncbi:Fic family protein [Shouchella clausii]|uniref:Fic/DOC family protein n=1 Tax=Shouchella clausii TaxID=79880 RepID=UPI0026F46540|nr:Fic family protein [Shouchella clausii]MDO7285882.1 Fic family protein [Shouchella clausii]MDO7305785.1 Fic family protein [Shouchella clausii]